MRTRCPHCRTLYQLMDEELEATNGLASCYSCKRAFNAWENETEDEEPGLAPVIDSSSELDKDDLPELTQASEKPTILEEDWDELLNAVEKKPTITAPKPVPAEKTRPRPIDFPEPDFELPEGLAPILPTATSTDPLLPRKQKKQKSKHGFLKSVGILLLLVLALAQLAWQQQDVLLSDQRVRNLLNQACTHLKCQLPPQRAANKFVVLKRNLSPDPDNPSALKLQITIRNNAGFAQSLPDLQLTLTNYNNNIIARQLFTAQQYQSSTEQLAPQDIADISLLMQDPGWQAAGFQIEFY